MTHFTGDGQNRAVRTVDGGERVVDVTVDEFRGLIQGRDGRVWEACNMDIMARIGRPNPAPPMAQPPR